ncbi:sensor domain-containing protein [Chitiniphilus eburneus]|uniref:sensor domain-containing protein n=1 Tax=Chitiniphilus eburneus TaxID=2571148 RepID=UPI00145ECD73|nr:bifunctional diguanylate cyclase/phosphodiesterase [Chitiniphilus eburneus]
MQWTRRRPRWLWADIRERLGLAHWGRPTPLVLFSGIAALIACGAVASVLYRDAQRAVRDEAQSLLNAVNGLTSHSMETWFADRQADLDVVAGDDYFVQALRNWLQQGRPNDIQRSQLRNYLERIKAFYGYQDILVLSAATDQVLLSVSGRDSPRSPYGDMEVIDLSHTDNLPELGNGTSVAAPPVLMSHKSGAEPVRWLIRRLLPGTEYSGGSDLELRFELDPTRSAFPLMHHDTLPTWKGSTWLIRRIGTQYECVNPSGQRIRLTHTSPDVERWLAALTHDESRSNRLIEGTSLNGEQVLSYSRRFSSTDWFITTSLPTSEVYADLHTQVRNGVIGAVGVLLLLAAWGANWWRGQRYRALQRENTLRSNFEQIFQNSREMMLLADIHGRVIDVNHAICHGYGRPREDMLGLRFRQLCSGQSVHSARGAVQCPRRAECQQQNDTPDFVHWLAASPCAEALHQRQDGSSFIAETNFSEVRLQNQPLVHVLIRDITARRSAEDQLRVAANIYRETDQAIVACDFAGIATQANAAYYALTGHRPEQVLGHALGPLLAYENLNVVDYDTILAHCAEHRRWQGERYVRHADGSIRATWHTVSTVVDTDQNIAAYIHILSDISSLKETHTRLDYLTRYDPLTSLPNRASLNDALRKALRSDQSQALNVALIGLDRFNLINQSMGLASGDSLLNAVGSRLKESLQDPSTQLFRFGGDEFVLIAPCDGHCNQEAKIRALLDSICKPLAVDGRPLRVTASMGIVTYPEHGDTADILLQRAHNAMRVAKEQGGNTYRLYEAGMDQAAQDILALGQALEGALERGELSLFLQPQVLMQEQPRLIGCEALLRWQHPQLGFVPPDRFIPIAEKNGLIGRITHWVLEEACRIWAGWRDQGQSPVPIAINISAAQFQEPQWLDAVAATMHRYRIPAGQLEMEMTESSIIQQPESVIALMHSLKALGIKLAIDDFGTGYSSLSYLYRYPVHKLKIDRSFVNRIDTEDGRAIVGAIVAMATSLRMRVIAEGVEEQVQSDFLASHGCIEAQGYFYGRPMPVDQFKQLLRPLGTPILAKAQPLPGVST